MLAGGRASLRTRAGRNHPGQEHLGAQLFRHLLRRLQGTMTACQDDSAWIHPGSVD